MITIWDNIVTSRLYWIMISVDTPSEYESIDIPTNWLGGMLTGHAMPFLWSSITVEEGSSR